MSEYQFTNPREMLSIVNTNLPVADDKPLYTTKGAGDDGPPVMAQMPDGDSEFLTEVDTHKVVYNPDNGQQFGVVTDEYEIINPPEIFGPLASEINDRDREIEGHFALFDGGARGYGELLLSDGQGIWPEDRSDRQDPVRTGVTFRWSHDGGISVKASAFAQDGACENTMRRVSDSIYVKHAGDVSERVDFTEEWARVLDQLGAFSDALEDVITTAVDYDLLDFSGGGDPQVTDDWLEAAEALEALDELDTPGVLNDRARDGINALFELLGFPRYLAMAATDRAFYRMANSDDPLTLSAWDAYSAATYAITHEARFDSGSSSDDRYHRIASDLLSNPELSIESANREAQTRLTPDEAQETLTLEDNAGDAMRAFKEREQQMREALASED